MGDVWAVKYFCDLKNIFPAAPPSSTWQAVDSHCVHQFWTFKIANKESDPNILYLLSFCGPSFVDGGISELSDLKD